MILINKNGERYFTLRATAHELGISHQMVAELCKSGKIKRKEIKVSVHRIPESEVLRLKKMYGR